ncbi:MAG: cysteine--tRNA ligase [Actinomycetota bacterium]
MRPSGGSNPVKLYDTMAREVVAIEPDPPLTMYSCGPTVYRYAHIGNLRTFLMADLIRRVFEYRGTPVRQVQNITDVGHMTDELFDRGEDRMMVAAGIENKSPEEIAEYYTQAFLEDVRAIGLLPAESYPRASDHIPHMIEIISKLIENKHAYEVDGTVYYDVSSFPSYGSLSGNTLDELQSGHRKDIGDENKRHHADFVLWMNAGPHRVIKFESPWGEGYPGWHIECSAMSMSTFGDSFDLHTGGEDNVFPHHEDEIAQSDGAVGHKVVRHWVHGAHLLSEGRKMSKSAQNFYTLRDLADLGHNDPLAIRLLYLQSKYRAQMNFTRDALRGAERTLERWRRLVQTWSNETAPRSDLEGKYEERFIDAVTDDLDTSSAIALVADVVSTASLPGPSKAMLLRRWDSVLGLNLSSLDSEAPVPTEVLGLIEARGKARQAKDFAESDRLRDRIRELGYEIEDTPKGPRAVRI